MGYLIFLSLSVLCLSSVKGQSSVVPNYFCVENNATVKFELSTTWHSAWNAASNCSVSQCLLNPIDNSSCRSSSTPCFDYRTLNNVRYCMPAIECSILEPCNNTGNLCSSNGSVCIVNSCCSARAICVPPSWTSFCPLAQTPEMTTYLPVFEVEINNFCQAIGSPTRHPNDPYLQIEAMSNYAGGCNAGYARSLMTMNEIDRLAPGTFIRSAEMKLFGPSFNERGYASVSYSLGGEVNVTNEVLIKRILSPWNANTTNWWSQPNTTDVNAVMIPSIPPTTPVADNNTALYNVTIDITQLARDIQASGLENNYGVMFQLRTERRYRAITFCSYYHPDIQRRPQIIITT